VSTVSSACTINSCRLRTRTPAHLRQRLRVRDRL
jgi:hypothetical protein